MRRIFTTISFLLLTILAFSQSPEKMSYQALVRNTTGQLLLSTEIGIQISILQGSVNGSSVYSETHTQTTNINGLLTIEIGTGTSNDNFSSIDWSNGVYFIKTEIDPTGGAVYTIIGVSQLLSVPYALYADEAGNIPDVSGIAVNSQAIIDTASQIRGDIPDVKIFEVGDFAHGGIVFWVDETGQHGLVCSKVDLDGGSGIRWYAGTFGSTQARGNGIYAGRANTSIIIAAQVAIGDDGDTYAARLCNELQVTEAGIIYGDWYLPSREELNMIYENRVIINSVASTYGGTTFASNYYWSSTEDASDLAWLVNFGVVGANSSLTTNYPGRVRAIRAF